MPIVHELRLRLVDPARLQGLIHEVNGEHKDAAIAEAKRRIAEAIMTSQSAANVSRCIKTCSRIRSYLCFNRQPAEDTTMKIRVEMWDGFGGGCVSAH